MNYRIVVLISLLSISSMVMGQTNHLLNLDQSIQIAKHRSYEMLSLKQDLKIAEYNLQSAISYQRTNVYANLTAPNYSKGFQTYTDSSDIIIYDVTSLDVGGELTIKQPLPTDGDISISSSINNAYDYSRDFTRMDLDARISLNQPINAIYYNQTKASIQTARLNYEKALKALKRSELNLIYNVTNSFYQLLSLQRTQELSVLNLERNTEAFDIAQSKYNAGLIREVDALQTEVDLASAQNGYDLAEVNTLDQMNEFKQLIGLEFEDSVALVSHLDYQAVVVDPEVAVKYALANRYELREQDIDIEKRKLEIKRNRSNGMISGDLVGYYGVSGWDKSDMGTSFGDSFDNAYDMIQNGGNIYGVGLNIYIPIIDWGRNRAQVDAQKAYLQNDLYDKRELERSIEKEVQNLVRQLNSSYKRLTLLEKSVEVAEKSYQITRARFSDGDIDSQDLALELQRLNNAQTSHLQAFISYKVNLANMMRKTLYDFETMRSLVE